MLIILHPYVTCSLQSKLSNNLVINVQTLHVEATFALTCWKNTHFTATKCKRHIFCLVSFEHIQSQSTNLVTTIFFCCKLPKI